MATFLEDILVKNFARMPLAVRIFTYMFVLLLYAYLLLVPRFINGELVAQSASGTFLPYRSGELRMLTEGRVFKFKVNEDGVWSAPIISRLPHTVKMAVYVVDADEFVDVEFSWAKLWTHDSFRLVVSGNPVGVRVVSIENNNSIASKVFVALERLLHIEPHSAWAGKLEFPPDFAPGPVDKAELNRVQGIVLKTYSEVMKKDLRQVNLKSPLTGASGPTFVQRIEIVQKVERQFGFKIPDEHWNYLNTVNELVDYVYKRVLLIKKGGPVSVLPSTSSEQKSVPNSSRPVFKR